MPFTRKVFRINSDEIMALHSITTLQIVWIETNTTHTHTQQKSEFRVIFIDHRGVNFAHMYNFFYVGFRHREFYECDKLMSTQINKN